VYAWVKPGRIKSRPFVSSCSVAYGTPLVYKCDVADGEWTEVPSRKKQKAKREILEQNETTKLAESPPTSAAESPPTSAGALNAGDTTTNEMLPSDNVAMETSSVAMETASAAVDEELKDNKHLAAAATDDAAKTSGNSEKKKARKQKVNGVV